jgi:hypothetical protein
MESESGTNCESEPSESPDATGVKQTDITEVRDLVYRQLGGNGVWRIERERERERDMEAVKIVIKDGCEVRSRARMRMRVREINIPMCGVGRILRKRPKKYSSPASTWSCFG